MAFIVEQLSGEKGVQLGYEEIVRPFSFGTNWQKIRVGVLWAGNITAVMGVHIAPFIGVCTGYEGVYAASTTDALFINYTHGIGSSAGSLLGTPPATYYQTTGGTTAIFPRQRVGTTTTALSAGTGSIYTQYSANPTNHYTAGMFTITKGTVGAAAVGFDLIYNAGGAASAATNISRSAFLAQMESEVTPLGTLSRQAVTSSNLPLRFDKDWDSMTVGWVRSTPTLVIACMTVVRFQ